MTSDITIIITCFNTEKYLSACLDSIIAQTFENWQVFLVDDGSTDGSLAIANDYMANDKRISVIVNDKNIGHYASINKALELTQSKYFSRVDADDTVDKHYLESCFQIIEKDDNLGAVFVNFNYFDELTSSSSDYPKRVCDKTFDIDQLLDKGSLMNGNSYFEGSLTKYFRGIGLIRTHWIKALGLFQEWRSEADLLFYLQLVCKAKVHCINERLYNYRRHEASVTSKIFETKQDLIWKKRFLIKANDYFLENNIITIDDYKKQKKSFLKEYYQHSISRSRKSLKLHQLVADVIKLAINQIR